MILYEATEPQSWHRQCISMGSEIWFDPICRLASATKQIIEGAMIIFELPFRSLIVETCLGTPFMAFHNFRARSTAKSGIMVTARGHFVLTVQIELLSDSRCMLFHHPRHQSFDSMIIDRRKTIDLSSVVSIHPILTHHGAARSKADRERNT